ncbi:MAG: 1-deoxy-D-xylulose-5-phosphate reductoisomerase [Actinomycetota bacterium]|nr:1-deoxy-D-xylulose-5-phosphate reductoisomerase [Actinomycetota bacterium]
MKSIAILGSTGSIGRQAIEVVEHLGTLFKVRALSCQHNEKLLLEQALRLGVKEVAITCERVAKEARGAFSERGIRLHAGQSALVEMIGESAPDVVLNAIVGSAGLSASIAALENGATLALANKESLVAGGSLVISKCKERKANIVPIDSEHSAIFQCLRGEDKDGLKRIILTASGGPFRNYSLDDLRNVSVADALRHPTWSMGKKVTIDSATLMNKGLEVIEAHYLFEVGYESIDVIVHPQSVIHSMIEMVDGSFLAQMGAPDMRTPIQYALTYPRRETGISNLLSLEECGELTFEKVDVERFPCLAIAYRAGRAGKTYAAAMNAANEEAVQAFLDRKIGFLDIPRIVEGVLEKHVPLEGSTLDEILVAEEEARKLSREGIASARF